MEIKSIELMRNARDKISEEIVDLSWQEKQKYFQTHSNALCVLLKKRVTKKHSCGRLPSFPRSPSGNADRF